MFKVSSFSNLSDSLSQIRGLGPKNLEKLASLGLETLCDLLFYYPFRWDDFSQITPIADLNLLEKDKVTISGTVSEVKNSRSHFRRLSVTQATINDQTGSLKAVWYNQPFLVTALKPDTTYRFHGKLKTSKRELFIQAPSFESGEKVEAAFIPVYHVTEGLTPKMLRYYIKQVLPLREKAPECLPLETIRRRGLTSLSNALLGIHFPKNKQSLFLAKRRLGFEELFILQLNYQLRKKKWEKKRAISLKINLPFIKKIIKDLPFELTKDQKIALWQILKDGEKERPMNRLLEGDVGSGKTVVAAIAALNVANNGRQAALMAPTEILAQQHFYELSKIALKTKIPCCLLTRSFARSTEKGGEEIKKEALLEKIKKGKIKIIVGTHSIIQEKALFSDLVLAIIDEQHRFGVRQRLSLIKKSEKNDGLPTITPHLLSMTATPIPRTLALTIYGDLDISLIKEMPKGRKKIITKAILPEKRPEAYRFIEQQIKKGRQAFVICPLIEESEILTTKAAEAEYQKLKNDIFPKLSVRLLHGRMKAIEKEEAMQSFKQNETAILVATSVVEVGVDIPNATIMMIEGAERFGLSQLHQLRGRVGRGDFQSYCFLFAESPSPKTWKRLRILENENNGFILAQKDLGLRGPGEFLGERQSGFSSLAIASLNDRALIKEAREEAQIIANNDSLLKSYPLLAQKLKFLEKEVHLE